MNWDYELETVNSEINAEQNSHWLPWWGNRLCGSSSLRLQSKAPSDSKWCL